ncbi:hypothetical protein ACFYW1_11165 [Streptomyces sp. NPDC002669]|uniref:hypothetical protein n=1 Tax=Streptomyces sp. NPDC002669 TaxID=3364658 RepID=UPI0036AA202F
MDEETHHPIQQSARHPAGSDEAAVVCALCGTSADGESTPPTWICSVENGRRQYFCEQCARTHIRAIESRLDSAWW